MRVLQLGRFWKRDGGVQMVAQLLCRGLAREGVDVTNLVAAATRTGSDQMVDGYRLVEAACWGLYFSTAISPNMVSLARQWHRERPFDLLHIHFPDPMSHLVSLALPASLPRVITWHSDIVKQKRLLALYRPFQVKEVLRAQALVAATQAHFTSSRQIPADYPPDRRHVIPFGLDYEKLALTAAHQALVESLRQDAAGRLLVFALGRHVTYKGFDYLIEAILQTQAQLLLGGDGPLTDALKQRAQSLGLDSRVRFVGRVAEEDLSAYYHACDVFCLPSITTNEAFGLVQLEAMACGKPVICTQLHNGVNVVNPHEITGLTVAPGNASALALAINRLATDATLRKRLGEQGRERALEQYSMKAMSQAHLRLYEQLLA